DTELEPVIRVALRQIKDYAKPLEVTIEGKTEIFWKWYLVSNAEAEPLIKSEMGIKAPVPQKKPEEKQPVEKKEEAQETLQEPQQQLPPEKPKPAVRKPRTAIEDTFSTKVTHFMKKNEIETIEFSIMKKNSEIDIIADVPSAVGKLRYYCKAKNKKRCNDSDLSSAFVQGQIKKLPVLFITSGDLTKRAQEMLSKEFKNITIKKI
ncbi:MAG: hypothetical protein GY861_00700, partial [bacterium]|nr:hypothetical protein [bacterium]